MQDAFETAAIAWIASRGLIAWRDEPAPGVVAHHLACDTAFGPVRITTLSDSGDCLLSLSIRLPARIPVRRAAEAAALAATRSTSLRLGAFEYEPEARAIRWRGAVLAAPERVSHLEVEFLYAVGIAAAAELMPELTLLLRAPHLAAEVFERATPSRHARAH
jgi:hypothetical protein